MHGRKPSYIGVAIEGEGSFLCPDGEGEYTREQRHNIDNFGEVNWVTVKGALALKACY